MSLGVLVVGIHGVIVSRGVAVKIGQVLGSGMQKGRVGDGSGQRKVNDHGSCSSEGNGAYTSGKRQHE